MMATATAAGRQPAPKASSVTIRSRQLPSDHARYAANIAAMGARFGLTSTDNPTSNPVTNARALIGVNAASTAEQNSAATGTSLIGRVDMNRNAGLDAISAAPARPSGRDAV